MSSPQNYSTLRNWLILLLPSLLGVFLFMTPVPAEKGLTIPVALMANQLKAALGDWMPLVLASIVSLSALATLIVKLWQPVALPVGSFLHKLLAPGWGWVLVRLLGAVAALMVITGVGPQMVNSKSTGALVFYDLLPVLLCVFIFAGLLLPLLLNFGLLEFIGTLMTKIMRPVFRLPGRSAVDCIRRMGYPG